MIFSSNYGYAGFFILSIGALAGLILIDLGVIGP
jgi:hypothetical protein